MAGLWADLTLGKIAGAIGTMGTAFAFVWQFLQSIRKSDAESFRQRQSDIETIENIIIRRFVGIVVAKSEDIREFLHDKSKEEIANVVHKQGPLSVSFHNATTHLRAAYELGIREKWVQRWSGWRNGALGLLGILVGLGAAIAVLLASKAMTDVPGGLVWPFMVLLTLDSFLLLFTSAVARVSRRRLDSDIRRLEGSEV